MCCRQRSALGGHRAEWGANFVVTVDFLTLLAGIGDDAAFVPLGVLAWSGSPTSTDRSVRPKTRTPPQIKPAHRCAQGDTGRRGERPNPDPRRPGSGCIHTNMRS
jgi:hypothetical protein